MKARAVVAQSERAASRLAAALQQLELEVAANHRAHGAELLATRRAFNEQLHQTELERRQHAEVSNTEKAHILAQAEQLSGRLANAEERAETGWQEASNLLEMAAQEQRHLETFEKLIVERHVRPTILSPLWRVAGFALGAATARMGPRVAMAR